MENKIETSAKEKGKAKIAPGSPCEKADWNDSITEIFIEICVQAIKDGYRPGTHFTPKGWQKVITEFRQQTNRKYGKQQLKNRWDNLKREWTSWKAMLKGETGLGWDYNKNTIDADDSWWLGKIKMFPDCAKFRKKGPLLLEKQDFLFSKVHASGENVWTPNSGNLPLYMQGDEINESVDLDASEDDTVSVDITKVTKKRKNNLSENENQGKKKISAAAGLKKSLDRIVDAVEASSAKMTSIKDSIVGSTIAEVIAILLKLPGVQKGDDLYMFACDLFLKPSYREMFVAQMDDDLRLQWLLNQQSKQHH